MNRTCTRSRARSSVALALATAGVLGLAACGDTTDTPRASTTASSAVSGTATPSSTEITSTGTTSTEAPSSTAPSSTTSGPAATTNGQEPTILTPEQLRTVSAGMWHRSAGLVQGAQDARGNAITSPVSLEVTMAMLRQGAKGVSAEQLDKAFGPELGKAETYRTLLANMTTRGDEGGQAFVTMANALLVKHGFALLPEFQQRLSTQFSAAAQSFTDPAQATAQANQFAKDQTHGLVPEIVPPGSLKDDLRLVLLNATYFKGVWDHRFATTKAGDFTTAKGTKVPGPMLQGSATYGYVKGDGFTAVNLPYRGQFSMWVLLPDDPKADPAELLPRLADAKTERRTVNVTMPKFTVASKEVLNPVLEPLVPSIFGDADLSGIAGRPGDLYVSAVRQAAKVSVDEKGTEAAAVTSAEVDIKAAPPSGTPVDFVADRPFAYVVQHDPTVTPLFAGTVGDPSVG